MACGIPCLTTTFVNQAINAIPDQEVLIADDPKSFKTQINELLSQPEKREQLKKAGRAFVMRNFNWENNVKTLTEKILT